MKITDSESIKDGELELIDALTGDLDWGVIEQILKDKHKLGLHDEVVYNSGDLVVHNDNIAYRLDFDVKVKLSVLINRDGECLSLSTSSDIGEESGNQETDLDYKIPDILAEDVQTDITEYDYDETEQETLLDQNDISESDIEIPVDKMDMDLDIEDDINLEDNDLLDSDYDLQEENETSENIIDKEDLLSDEPPLDPATEKALSEEIESLEDIVDNDVGNENISQMASQIAEMISEINER